MPFNYIENWFANPGFKIVIRKFNIHYHNCKQRNLLKLHFHESWEVE